MNPSVVPLPPRGDVFLDGLRSDRSMRVTWHPDQGLVVVSLWRGDTCIGTLRLPRDEVPRLVSALVDGMVDAPPGDAAADAPPPRRAG